MTAGTFQFRRDIMLASLCHELDLVLVTTDKVYTARHWRKTENWL